MSPVRKKIVEIIESLPYDLDEEVLKRDTKDILQEITREYVDKYGIDDLSEDDKDCIRALIGNKIWERKVISLNNNYKDDLSMEKISELLKKAPTDDGTFYGVLYDLYLFIGLAKSANDIKKGKTITLEELHKEMEELYASTSRKFG